MERNVADTEETESEVAEMSSWDRWEKVGLVWRNRKKISQIINDYLYLPFFLFIILWLQYTAKTQYRKFKTNVPRKGTARPQSQFLHSCFCKRFIYYHDRSAYSAAGKNVDRSWEYINPSQTLEYGNGDWGRAVPFLGIHKSEFLCSAAVSGFVTHGTEIMLQLSKQSFELGRVFIDASKIFIFLFSSTSQPKN